MNPTVMVVAIVALLFVGFVVLLKQPSNWIAHWIEAAGKALQSRDYETAESYYAKLSRIRTKIRDPVQKAGVEFVSEHGLGLCYQARDDFAAAERCLVRTVELWDEGLSEERSLLANLLGELAVAQHAQGKTAESERTRNRLREVCDAASESEVHQVSEMVIGAANGASARGYNDLAFELARIARSVLDDTEAWHDGAVAHTQIALASFHMMHCEYGPARELIEMALDSAGDELDRNDLDNAYFHLGSIHVLSGNFEAAKRAFEHSLEIRSEDEGEDHWQTSITVAALGDMYRAAGEYDEAKAYSDTAWRIQSEQLPADDVIRAGTVMQRAMLLIDFGDFDEADALLTEVIESGAGRTLLAGLRLIQGVSAYTQGRHSRAEALFQKARELAEERYGAGHRMTCEYRMLQGANWIRMGRYDEAETILTETLAIIESLQDPSVIDLADLLWTLAELYVETDRVSEAETAVLRAKQLVEGRVAATHLINAELSELLGRIQHARADFDGAIAHFEHALDVRGKVQRPDHPRLAQLLEFYARSLADAGETEKSDEQRARAERIRSFHHESA